MTKEVEGEVVARVETDGVVHKVVYGDVEMVYKCTRRVIRGLPWNPEHPVNAGKPEVTCIGCLGG